jgi:hypothetical protein
MKRGPAPILVERTLLLSDGQPDSDAIERLVSFLRDGHRLLLVAPRPRRWRPTRKAVDRDLALQQELHQMFARAGTELDGVLYLAAGLFSRRSAMAKELDSIAQRYERKMEEITLIGRNSALLEAYGKAGGPSLSVDPGPSAEPRRYRSLGDALKELDARAT